MPWSVASTRACDLISCAANTPCTGPAASPRPARSAARRGVPAGATPRARLGRVQDGRAVRRQDAGLRLGLSCGATTLTHASRMHAGYPGTVSTTVVQVRDLPQEVVDTLKARAELRGQSLAAYLRDLLTQEASMPPVEEVMAGIAARDPVSYTIDDLRSFVRDGLQ